MGQVRHGSATTTHAVRAAIQRSQASLAQLSRELGINPKTVAKWRKRATVEDMKTGPSEPRSTVLTEAEEAAVIAFRRHTLLPLDDCLYALQPSIPHLTRSALHRCLQRHGISRLPDVEGDKPQRQKFKRYPIGFFHIDIAEVQTGEGKLYLFVGIDRTSKFAVAQLVATAITATVPRSDTSGARSKGHFVKADFNYEHDADIYRCPAGQALKHCTTTEQQGLQMRRYWTNACKDCDLKDRCTTGQERRVSRWEHEHLVEASNALRRSPSAPMSVRRSTVEHPFGTIKSWTGSCHFLTRRLSGVRTEMALNVLAYNIKRMIALVGIKALMAAVPE